MMSAEELREKIVRVVRKNGGHLASSLGAVELSMALVDIFDPMTDRVIWDVGHQAYAWKILTGRDESFDTLRQLGGVSPFPNPAESGADAAVAGHAGVALSVAAGMAAARDRLGTKEHVIAVVGDGAIVNGTSFEALNNIASATEKLIVILNDNEMSISHPAGSLAKLLGRLITNVRYNRVKSAAEAAGHNLKLTFLRSIYHRIESRIKGLFLANQFFEQFGLRYIGPIDGHDLVALRDALTVAKEDKRSVLVHVVTKKGRGYAPAEMYPTRWHGISPAGGNSQPGTIGWSDAFGEALSVRARTDERIVALTAGMKDGTGLSGFASEFPSRFFDVGIAEGHMVAFAAGLAARGMRPVVAVYSTFLQRAIDQIIHDVCIANLPVVFCVDRAGVVGADGATHQGLYDIALLRSIPTLTICQPKDAADLESLLSEALKRKGPTVIRYPRGGTGGEFVLPEVNPDATTAIWATGDCLSKACAIASRVSKATVVNARYIKPYDENLLASQRAKGMRIVSIENGSIIGGLGDAISADCKFGWPDVFIPHGTPSELEKAYGLDVDSIAEELNHG